MNIVYDNSYLLYYCNIGFPSKIRKVVRNNLINIMGYGGKKLLERFGVCTYVRVLRIESFVRYFLSIVGILMFCGFVIFPIVAIL